MCRRREVFEQDGSRTNAYGEVPNNGKQTNGLTMVVPLQGLVMVPAGKYVESFGYFFKAACERDGVLNYLTISN